MYFDNVSIIGLGFVDAPTRITSEEIEGRLADTLERFGMRPNLIQELSGIYARRHWINGIQPSDVGTEAAELAIEDAGIVVDDLGIVINTSVTRDYIEPAVAALIAGNLGVGSHTVNFDVGNACLGFLNGMQIVGNMIERDQVEYGLVVAGETTGEGVEKTIERLSDPNCTEDYFRKNFASLTLGSGATAMILARSDKHPDGHKIIGGVSKSATEHSRLCVAQPDEMLTDTQALLIEGLQLAIHTFADFVEAVDTAPAQFAHLFIHQVSHRHTEKWADILRIDKSKIHRIYPEFGNIGPAGIIISLAKAAKDELIQTGERIALLGVGSGLNCSMMAVDW
jgi:3-oxoacyl-[acyl-carrier-protein] synthase-3